MEEDKDFDVTLLSLDEVYQQVNAVCAEIEEQMSYPIYALYPDTGPYSKDKYEKHMVAINGTKNHTVVYFRAANRSGKTTAACVCAGVWTTGIVPSYYDGRLFDRPTIGWIVGVDYLQLRDGIQKILFRSVTNSTKGGMIPKNLLYRCTYQARPAGAVLDAYVIHIPSYNKLTLEQKNDPKEVEAACSIITFHAWGQEVESLQSAKLDWIIIDEEPPMEYYSELRLRTMSGEIDGRPGSMFIAATPLKNFSEFVLSFEENQDKTKLRVDAGWGDTPHMSKEEQAEILKDIPENEILPRTQGLPAPGGGMAFPSLPSLYVRDDIQEFVEKNKGRLKFIAGIDHGSTTAVVLLAIDPLTNITYAYHEITFKDTAIPIKAYALVKIMRCIYMSDTSINGVNEYDQRRLNESYKEVGLTFINPNKKLKQTMVNSVSTALATGLLKVSSTCFCLNKSLKTAYRDPKTGRLTKTNDDHHLDALLYGWQGKDTYAMSYDESMEPADTEGYYPLFFEQNNKSRWV